jgi:hypothetical protein
MVKPQSKKEVINCMACKDRKQICCRRLCIKAERYANQDYKGQREKCFAYIYGCDPECIPDTDNAFYQSIPSTKLQIAKLFFLYHLKPAQISDITYKSKQYVYSIIKQYRTQLRTRKRHN